MLIDNGKVIVEGSDLVETFNVHYINIVEKSSRQKPCNFVSNTNSLEDDAVINEIVQQYSYHPSILKIRENFDNLQTVEQFPFNSETTSEIYKLLKTIDDKKATGTDKIPPKLVKISAEVLSQPLADAINNSISKGVFPDNAKIASVSPIDKQSDDKNKVSNFRPVSVLNTFSKISESIIENQLHSVLNNIVSPYLAAYRESYSTQHVLIRLLEEWRENLDNNYTVGGVLMDLSKAFDCIPHDLLIAKLSAYGLNGNALKYIYTYLKNRKQCVRVNNVCSDFKDIISGVLQGSIVGSMLSNAFLNDFFFCIRKASVHNFADDNTLSSFAKSVTLLVEILTTESQNAIKWFSENKMIVNPDKFKSITMQKNNQTSKPKQFLIGNDIVEVGSSVKLLNTRR